ncbi:MAG: tyrosine-type recombinase/integrase [Pseudobdellovibrionaceae bacterium]|nr:tyrosine-type recombinase/integrase [Bdellovibrionales bacterium]USN48605.1 MAG: tyrosine-type recombinase/integrase [Pseudobdellovibrionaceae bacterium]
MALTYWVEFFDDLEHVRGRSKNTVMAYRRDLELYAEFAQTGSDIGRFFEFLKRKKLSTRSQARVISSLRTYFRFCEAQGQKVPELRQLRPPKVKAKLPQAISVEDFEQLFKACATDNAYRTARNQITLLLLFGLGCRVSELIQLNQKDFNETEGWLKILGKGNKERLVPLTTRLLRELKDYLIHVRGHLVVDSTDSILINDRGRRPSRVDIWRWLNAWSQRAGFEETVSPHQFRHGCATSLLEGGADLRSIQMLLGHSSIQTTQIYTSVSSKKMQEEIDEHHPLSQMDV